MAGDLIEGGTPRHIVAMGVTATGKSSVAELLAERLRLTFVEGDDLHPPSNIDKMTAGIALTDEDRMPWLRAIAEAIAEHHAAGTSTVVTCSALRRAYRDVLRGAVPDTEIFFLHLHADFDVLLGRMSERKKHFMPSSLLQSQFDTLEPLDPDEVGAVVDVTPPIEEVVTAAAKVVRDHYRA